MKKVNAKNAINLMEIGKSKEKKKKNSSESKIFLWALLKEYLTNKKYESSYRSKVTLFSTSFQFNGESVFI